MNGVVSTAFAGVENVDKADAPSYLRHDVTGQTMPIYVIDFVICQQTHKQLLTDSRSCAGTLLDHRQMFNVLVY